MTADTPGGWPDAARPGVPLHPERPAWHWLAAKSGGAPWCWWWSGTHWQDDDLGAFETPAEVAELHSYIAPCLTPAEVAAREAAAWCAGWDAGFDAGFEQGDDFATAFEWGTRPTLSYDEAKARIEPPVEYAAAIRARGEPQP